MLETKYFSAESFNHAFRWDADGWQVDLMTESVGAFGDKCADWSDENVRLHSERLAGTYTNVSGKWIK